MKEYVILKLLSKGNYITYNKELARKIGVNEAIVFGELCGLYEHFGQKEFFFEQERLAHDVSMSVFKIQKAIDTLTRLNLITKCRKGIPCKLYYTINVGCLIEFLSDDSETSLQENKGE